MLRYLLAFSCLLLLSSCLIHKKTRKKPEKPRIEYGMTHDEVLGQITDRSELVVGEFNYPEGRLVAYQYTRYGKAALKVPKYYLYFLNDTLVRKSDPEPLRKGSKLALRDHREWLADQEAERELREAETARRAKQEEERARKAEEREQRREHKGSNKKKKRKSKEEE
jgi:hypothetical protein